IAAASSADKLALCRARGADEVIDYAKEDLKERTKALAPNGVDVIYDPVGGPYTEQALRGIAGEGRHLVVGFAAGDIPKLPLNLALLKGCQIVGVFWGVFASRHPERNRAHIERVLAWIAEGRVAPPVDRVYPFDRAAEALTRIASRQAIGKIVL